ncbi:hypothetical protein CCMA1212_005552 [Trichoderma ghanense]|uniref:NWD NACHT-NTPase N-terminal domain-containing protein n=1 Tax=Trichoderma ghanense TaxID=65468 RepID=A0ABY2H377_9HYPO
MPKTHDSRLIKLVGKILHHDFHHHGPQDDSDSESGVATPEWMGPYRAPSSTSSSYSIPKGSGRDKSISMDLWNEAYNSLRDSTRSAGLVTVYESILCQELSHGQSIGGLNQSLPRSDKERFKALITITESGLKRSRGTKLQANTPAKAIIRAAGKTIKSVWATYPSTAVAWSGICILTPLLLGPTIEIEEMKRGALHVLGRIPWYMHLSEILLASAWKNDLDFNAQRDRVRDRLLQLYRKVLEFEMNCVCAAASSWNIAAKNIVGWHGLGAIVREIEELDNEMTALMVKYIDRGVAQNILRLNENLKLDVAGEEETLDPESSHAANAMNEPNAMVNPSTVRV